ncbi:MAG: elongation factor P maturation arginine rhamnosyltransferase EarP [Lautropia sp.]|nr:elongation factor P maturation arginine rhamnosyltransferase EarP [Lautropia sp.]
MTSRETPLRWDLICRVVDNFGDAAVMWRLARQLALEHDCPVRLLIDQPAVLQRLVPNAAPGGPVDGVMIDVMPDEPADDAVPTTAGEDAAANVVVTGFHAALPASYRRWMARRRPVWVNLEYLSAETWIDGFHGLPSPRADGLTEYYFYPGFTAASGGLLREAGLLARRDAFQKDPANRRRFLAAHGVRRRAGETTASLLCYPDAPLKALALQLKRSRAHLHLLVPEGAAAGAADAEALSNASGGRMRISRIPFLPQQSYDHLLWSCDLNFVRGEDSLVRALWAARPFVWQPYVQADGIHLRKLDAFLQRLGPGGPLADAMLWWNGAPGSSACSLVDLLEQPARATDCMSPLQRQTTAPDLATRLLEFVTPLVSPKCSPS